MNNDKLKRFLNKKMILGSLAMLSMVAIIFVTSFTPFILDPSKIGTTEFWTDEIILVVISIFSVICCLFMGQVDNAQNPLSEIAKQNKTFIELKPKVERAKFEQWVHQVLEPRDQNEIYKRVLDKNHILQPSLITLARSDLKSLIGKPQRINNVWYDELTEKQYNEVIKIKNGKYNLEFVSAGYYLTNKHFQTNLTRSERANNEDKKRIGYVAVSLITKIGLVIIVGCILGMFTKDMLTDQDIETSLVKLFSRLFNTLSSAFLGYVVGCQDNDILASYIEMKNDTINEQIADINFTAKSVEELAKEKYAKMVKEENDKNIKKIEEQGVIAL